MYEVTPLLGPDATEPVVCRGLAGAGVVHIASHGFKATNIIGLPHQEGVWLARSASDTSTIAPHDGILQAWELGSRVRTNADLVVYSTCESGRSWWGAMAVSEFTRRTLLAGARAVLSAQWPISDEGTTPFMITFHTSLRAGAAKDEALRDAIAAQLTHPRFAHPFYWAGFRLTGDMEPLSR